MPRSVSTEALPRRLGRVMLSPAVSSSTSVICTRADRQKRWERLQSQSHHLVGCGCIEERRRLRGCCRCVADGALQDTRCSQKAGFLYTCIPCKLETRNNEWLRGGGGGGGRVWQKWLPSTPRSTFKQPPKCDDQDFREFFGQQRRIDMRGTFHERNHPVDREARHSLLEVTKRISRRRENTVDGLTRVAGNRLGSICLPL